MNSEDKLLGTSFYAKILLKTEMNNIKHILGLLPNAKKITDKPVLKYELCNADGNDKSILDVSDDYISLQFFSRQNPLAYKANFLKFISILALLKDELNIDIGDLYSYVIEAVDQNWQNSTRNQYSIIASLKERISVLDKSNFSLGLKIIELSDGIRNATMELEIFRNFSKTVVEKTREMETKEKTFSHPLLQQLGIDMQLVKNVETKLYKNK